MKKIVFILLILSMGSCHPIKKAARAMDTWIGKSKSEILSYWGQPKKTEQDDLGEILTYFGQDENYKRGGVCTIQFYIDKNERVYNRKWENCSHQYLKKQESRR